MPSLWKPLGACFDWIVGSDASLIELTDHLRPTAVKPTKFSTSSMSDHVCLAEGRHLILAGGQMLTHCSDMGPNVKLSEEHCQGVQSSQLYTSSEAVAQNVTVLNMVSLKSK